MLLFIRIAFLLIFTLAIFCSVGLAQKGADGKPISLSSDGKDDEDKPTSYKESIEKLRIEKDKKDHQEMVDRGEEAVKLSDEVKKSFEENGKLSNEDLAKVAKVEKIVKKIRTELGGNDDDGDDKDQASGDKPGGDLSLAGAVDSLQSKANALYDELKKTTRFTISAAAIFSTNAVLKLAQTLRFGH